MSTSTSGSRLTAIGAVGAVIAALAGCSAAEAPAPDRASTTSNAPAEAPAPRTVADLFPEAPGKPLVLANCGTCHAVACSVIGQRPTARWASLQDDHRDKASSLSEAELDTIFTYLSSHFNDSTPEPRVPPHFLEQGCTPF